MLLAAAGSAQSARQYDKARTILERGLARHSKEAALYKAIAGVEFRAGKRKQALETLRRGIRQAAAVAELRVLLAEQLIEADQPDEARKIVAELHKDNLPPALPDYLRARLMMTEKIWGQAANLLERCRAELPAGSDWSAAVNFALGTCYGRLGDVDHQLAAYERALARDPSWTAARMGLGAALLAAGRVDEALTQFRTIESGPDVPADLWPMLARSLLLRNLRLPAARRDWNVVSKAIEKIEESQETSVEIPLLRADLLLAQGKLADAAALLAKACARQPDEAALWCSRAELAARQERWSEAEDLLLQGEKRLGDRLDFRLARLRLLTQRGGPEARQTLTSLGRNAAALAADDKVLLDRALAGVWTRLGDAAAARQFWLGLARQLPYDLQCRIALFELALKDKHLDEARELRKDIQELEGPGGLLSLYTQAALIAAESGKGRDGTLAQAKQILAGLARKQEGWPRIPLLEARIAELEHNPNRALDFYLRAFELGERQGRLAQRLVSMLHARKRNREADQVLRRLEEDGPLGKDLTILGADIALALFDTQRALRLAEVAVSPKSRDMREQQWLGRVLDSAGEHARAETAWRQAVALAPHNPDCWLALIQHLARNGKSAAADVALEQMRAQLPADRRDLAVARALEVLGRLEPAETLYQKLAAGNPADFITLENAAEFYLRQDRPDKAEPLLQRLLEPAVGTPANHAVWIRRHLAVLLGARETSKDRQLGLDLLQENRKLLGEQTSDERARALVLAGDKSQRRQAVQSFERTLTGQPLGVAEQYWLVQLYERAGELDKARDWILGLMAADPDQPRYLARYIRILLGQEQVTEAKRIFDRLERLEPASPRTRELKDAVTKALQG
ncbi:MAG: tetratricopeptide repeat protein [Planctomycetes bacterium]|nr:tetratricopeptide repeat protein [Planctomycetota bacterium]